MGQQDITLPPARGVRASCTQVTSPSEGPPVAVLPARGQRCSDAALDPHETARFVQTVHNLPARAPVTSDASSSASLRG